MTASCAGSCTGSSCGLIRQHFQQRLRRPAPCTHKILWTHTQQSSRWHTAHGLHARAHNAHVSRDACAARAGARSAPAMQQHATLTCWAVPVTPLHRSLYALQPLCIVTIAARLRLKRLMKPLIYFWSTVISFILTYTSARLSISSSNMRIFFLFAKNILTID